MKAFDHETFREVEIDALYDELDSSTSAAVRDHAASCASCAKRFERLRVARQRGLSALSEAVPENFESRIMAAVDAALAKRAGAQVLPMNIAGGGRPAPGVGAKVIPFFARPSFAVAATLILVLGAAAILAQTSMSKMTASKPMAMGESSPAVAAASGYAPAEQAAAPNAVATSTADPPIGAVALNERSGKDLTPPAMAAAPPEPRPAPGRSPPPSRPTGGGDLAGLSAAAGAGPTQAPSLAAAKSLYDAGRYAEALPRFEALKATTPEAELYAARCVMRTSGCGAAAPRFDTAAQRNSGSVAGSRARIEGAKCYQQLNQPQAARMRYQAAKEEGFLESEATRDLEALDQPAAAPAATSSPGTPGGGKATPKAPINTK